MKNFLRLLTLALLLVMGGKAQAASLTALNDIYTIKYKSVDANNNPIELSERIFISSYYDEIKYIVLDNHPTTTSNNIVPTGSKPLMKDSEKYMVSEACMVVAPDYLGYQQSSSTTHPYMCGTLTSRNLLDGLKAARDYIVTKKTTSGFALGPLGYNKNKKYYFGSGCYTINMGYSQGGYNTMAFQKYMETEASTADKNLVNLKLSICGAGPFQQSMMMDLMEEDDDIFYSVYLPYFIEGLMYTYGKSTMRGLTKEEIFTEKFLDTTDGYDVFKVIHEKNTVAADINTMIKNKFGGKVTFYDIIRPEYKDHNSKLYRTIRKAVLKNDLINDEWTPSTPIVFFHYTQDDVVPYEESQLAYNTFKARGCNVKLYRADDSLSETSYGTIGNGNGLVNGSYDQTHMGYGTKFYLWFYDNVNSNLR